WDARLPPRVGLDHQPDPPVDVPRGRGPGSGRRGCRPGGRPLPVAAQARPGCEGHGQPAARPRRRSRSGRRHPLRPAGHLLPGTGPGPGVIDLALAGSTGSIGRQAVDVVLGSPGKYRVVTLGARSSVELLAEQARLLRPERGVVTDPAAAGQLEGRLPSGTELAVGDEALAAAVEGVEVVLNAVVGFAGLGVTLAAIRSGARLALANKESLIAAGPVVNEARRRSGAEIVPVDSEHSAVHQCLRAAQSPNVEVARIVLTASGGPFRGWSADRLAEVSVADALAHPTWSMGPKITVDSSTLMNKGLEVIEAHELFAVELEQIE